MAKVKKSAVKVVKKKWVPIYATAEFNKVKIGETYVVNTKDAVGKPLTVNLMTLTMDPKKQNISVSFVTDRIEGDGVHTHLVGYQMSPVSLKKIVRRNRTKVGDSFLVSTKDKKIRIKPIIVTRGHASKAICTELRRKSRAFIAVTLKNMTLSQLTTELVQRKYQRKLQDLLKKIHPLSVCDIRMFTVVTERDTLKPKEEKPEAEPVKESTEPEPSKEASA